MNEKKPFMVGNDRLSELNGFEDVSKNGVRGCFIPYDQNPSIFVGVDKESNRLIVDLDVLVRETRNSKSGSSHFIKLNVRKANREKFALSYEAVDSMKIVGNLFTRVPGQQSQSQGMQTQQGGFQRPTAAPQYPQQQRGQNGGGFAPASSGYGRQGGNDGLPAGW